MHNEKYTRVWDPLVRTFHWLLVVAFLVAFGTEDDSMTAHSWAGYLIIGAISVRLIWGLIGTQHAKFKDFVTAPGEAFKYAKDVLLLRAKRYIGHNPAGGLMIIVLMASLVITSITGIAVYGAEEHAGPMANLFANTSKFWGDFFEELHEFFANFTLLLVLVHIGGVAIESMLHKENLVKSMFNGMKRTE